MSTPTQQPADVLTQLETLLGPLTDQQRERLGLPPIQPPAPQPAAPAFERRVIFTVDRGPTSGAWFIQAANYRSRDIVDIACFHIHPAKLEKFKKDPQGNWTPWKPFGQLPPPEIVAEYTRVFDAALAELPTGVPGAPSVESPRAGRRGDGPRKDQKALGPFPPLYPRRNFDDSGKEVK